MDGVKKKLIPLYFIFVDATYRLIFYSGLIAVLRFIKRHRHRIITYHRISADADPFVPSRSGLYGTPQTFARQMRYLMRHYHVISLADYLESRRTGAELPKYTVIITFDDGFKDNYQHAFAVLTRYGLPASIFLIADTLIDQQPIWLHKFYYLAETIEESRLLTALNEMLSPMPLFESSRQALRQLKHDADRQFKDRALDKIYRSVAEENQAPSLYLSLSEIETMQPLIEFGSHGRSHQVMSALDEKALLEETVVAKDILERRLGRPIRHFAYPFGDQQTFSDATTDVIRQHYDCALTAVEGFNGKKSDPYRLKRFSIPEGGLHAFAASLEGVRAVILKVQSKLAA